MIQKNNQISPWFAWIICVSVLRITSLCKMSLIVGSSFAFFSMAPIVVPLSGMLSGVAGSFLVFAGSCITRFFFNSSLSLHLLAYHIPGLFASLYWACNHWVIRLLPSVACMILFLVHPIGSSAVLYACLWAIPVAIFFTRSTNLYLNALASTFTAHAIGSVIWLYTMPMTADQWLGLIPLALVERFTFAGGMVLMYHVIQYG